jgi:hypothetical protein
VACVDELRFFAELIADRVSLAAAVCGSFTILRHRAVSVEIYKYPPILRTIFLVDDVAKRLPRGEASWETVAALHLNTRLRQRDRSRYGRLHLVAASDRRGSTAKCAFHCSVRENIALADPGMALERVIGAAALAGAHEFILRTAARLRHDYRRAPASSSHRTLRWREMDSNFQYASTVR